MTHPWQRPLAALALALTLGLGAGQAAAAAPADYPNRPVKIVVSLPPGSGADTVARHLATWLQQRLKQPFVVENKPGANSFLAAQAVARAEPDGYTMFVASNSPMSTNLVAFKQLPYDPVRDFVPVAPLARFPMALVVAAPSPYRTLAELTTQLRAGKSSYGGGTATYRLAIEQYQLQNAVSAMHVPYKGTSAALLDLAGGNVDFSMGDISAVLPLVRGGKLRALAVTSRTRQKEPPEVPTMIESGNPGYEFYAWVAAFFPAKVDPAIVRKVAAAAGDMLKSPATVAFLAGIGGEPMPGGPQELADFQEREIANLRRIAAKVKMEQE